MAVKILGKVVLSEKEYTGLKERIEVLELQKELVQRKLIKDSLDKLIVTMMSNDLYALRYALSQDDNDHASFCMCNKCK